MEIKIDKRVTWVTLTEACDVWEIGSKSTVIWAFWRQAVLMRKSAGVWMVLVSDMRLHFGEPKKPILVKPD